MPRVPKPPKTDRRLPPIDYEGLTLLERERVCSAQTQTRHMLADTFRASRNPEYTRMARRCTHCVEQDTPCVRKHPQIACYSCRRRKKSCVASADDPQEDQPAVPVVPAADAEFAQAGREVPAGDVPEAGDDREAGQALLALAGQGEVSHALAAETQDGQSQAVQTQAAQSHRAQTQVQAQAAQVPAAQPQVVQPQGVPTHATQAPHPQDQPQAQPVEAPAPPAIAPEIRPPPPPRPAQPPATPRRPAFHPALADLQQYGSPFSPNPQTRSPARTPIRAPQSVARGLPTPERQRPILRQAPASAPVRSSLPLAATAHSRAPSASPTRAPILKLPRAPVVQGHSLSRAWTPYRDPTPPARERPNAQAHTPLHTTVTRTAAPNAVPARAQPELVVDVVSIRVPQPPLVPRAGPAFTFPGPVQPPLPPIPQEWLGQFREWPQNVVYSLEDIRYAVAQLAWTNHDELI